MINTNATSGNTLANIKRMAPKLTRKQQHIVFGMVLGFMAQNDGKPAGAGRSDGAQKRK